jgi:hypothetical protein
VPKAYTQSEITEAKERLSRLVAVYEECVKTKVPIAPITSFKKLAGDVKTILGALDTANEEVQAKIKELESRQNQEEGRCA